MEDIQKKKDKLKKIIELCNNDKFDSDTKNKILDTYEDILSLTVLFIVGFLITVHIVDFMIGPIKLGCLPE